MKNELVITFEGDYIQVISNGEKNYEFAKRVWSGAVVACEEHDCYDILGIADTTVPLTAWEGYEHADLFENWELIASIVLPGSRRMAKPIRQSISLRPSCLIAVFRGAYFWTSPKRKNGYSAAKKNKLHHPV